MWRNLLSPSRCTVKNWHQAIIEYPKDGGKGTSERWIAAYETMRRHIPKYHISNEVVFPYYGLFTSFILCSAAKDSIYGRN